MRALKFPLPQPGTSNAGGARLDQFHQRCRAFAGDDRRDAAAGDVAQRLFFQETDMQRHQHAAELPDGEGRYGESNAIGKDQPDPAARPQARLRHLLGQGGGAGDQLVKAEAPVALDKGDRVGRLAGNPDQRAKKIDRSGGECGHRGRASIR